MAKQKINNFSSHVKINKRTSIGNPNRTKLKTSSMNKHKRLSKGI